MMVIGFLMMVGKKKDDLFVFEFLECPFGHPRNFHVSRITVDFNG
jgi:hypothetical protein